MSGMSLRLLSAPLTSPPGGSCFMALNVVTVTPPYRVCGTGAFNLSNAPHVALAIATVRPCRAHSPINHRVAAAAPENRTGTQPAGRRSPSGHAAGKMGPAARCCLPAGGHRLMARRHQPGRRSGFRGTVINPHRLPVYR